MPKDKRDSAVIFVEESFETPVGTGFSVFESKLDSLADSLARMSDSLSRFTQLRAATPLIAEGEDSLLDEGPASEFDPAETVVDGAEDDGISELPYEGLFKDTEDCGNSACTKKPAKEQFSFIQKKYFHPENCEFLKAPRMNLELWDDLLDKTKSRECSFQSFQKNLIRGITPVVQLANEVVEAKKRKADVVPFNDIYDLSVDASTLLGNSVCEFSMKRGEMLKSELAPAYKSLCHESQPIAALLFGDELPQSIPNISQVKRMAARGINYDRRRSSGSVYTNF